jgi:predicted transcriptional regulator
MSDHQRLKHWLNRLRRSRTPTLGRRELDILDVLWSNGDVSAQDVLDDLPESISLSTVQSTLERLHRKNLLQRNKQGRAFLYRANISKAELVSSMLHDMSDDLSNGDDTALLCGFVNYLADTHPALHDRMQDALQAEINAQPAVKITDDDIQSDDDAPC